MESLWSRGPSSSGWSRPRLVVVIYLGLALAAVVWGALRGEPNVWRLGQREPAVAAGLLGGLVAGLLIVLLSRLAVRRYGWAQSLHRELRQLLFPLGTGESFVLAGASSIGEEMFFRGALLPTIGLFGSSAVFALLHIGPSARHLPWTLSSFGAGLLFGAMFLWSGDLTGPVVAHFLVNFLNLRHVARTELRDGG